MTIMIMTILMMMIIIIIAIMIMIIKIIIIIIAVVIIINSLFQQSDFSIGSTTADCVSPGSAPQMMSLKEGYTLCF